MLAALVLLVAAELGFGLSGQVSEALGRGFILTGRSRTLDTAPKISVQIRFSGRELKASG